MKKSELKAIIKEEIAKMYGSDDAIQSSVNKIFGTKSGKENIFGLPLEKLEGYDKLPNTRAEANLSSRNYIFLPSIENPGSATTYIHSKEEAQEWAEKFKNKFGIDDDVIRFEKDKIGNFKVINSPKYNEEAGIESKVASSFYDKLKFPNS